MSKYFDRDFFKFFMGFVAIITFSLVIIIATQIYGNNSETQTANVVQTRIVDKN